MIRFTSPHSHTHVPVIYSRCGWPEAHGVATAEFGTPVVPRTCAGAAAHMRADRCRWIGVDAQPVGTEGCATHGHTRHRRVCVCMCVCVCVCVCVHCRCVRTHPYTTLVPAPAGVPCWCALSCRLHRRRSGWRSTQWTRQGTAASMSSGCRPDPHGAAPSYPRSGPARSSMVRCWTLSRSANIR